MLCYYQQKGRRFTKINHLKLKVINLIKNIGRIELMYLCGEVEFKRAVGDIIL